MPKNADAESVTRPSIYRVDFACSTGFAPAPDKRDYHNKVKADNALRDYVDGAKKRGATWGEGFIRELFKDKDTGRFVEVPDPVYAVYRFGKKP